MIQPFRYFANVCRHLDLEEFVGEWREVDPILG
jgi:hypothetical protein